MKVNLGNILEALVGRWRNVPLLEAAKGDCREHTSSFRIHNIRIEGTDTVVMFTEAGSAREMHAADRYLELLSEPEPECASVNPGVCIVNSHRHPCVKLLSCDFEAPVS